MTPVPIFQSFVMPRLLVQSHEELSAFQENVQASEPSLHSWVANTFPGAEQTSLGSWAIQGLKRQKVFTSSHAASARILSDPSQCHLFWALSFICLTYPQSCSIKSLKHIQTFFLTVSRLRVSLNPETASVSSL